MHGAAVKQRAGCTVGHHHVGRRAQRCSANHTGADIAGHTQVVVGIDVEAAQRSGPGTEQGLAGTGFSGGFHNLHQRRTGYCTTTGRGAHQIAVQFRVATRAKRNGAGLYTAVSQ